MCGYDLSLLPEIRDRFLEITAPFRMRNRPLPPTPSPPSNNNATESTDYTLPVTEDSTQGSSGVDGDRRGANNDGAVDPVAQNLQFTHEDAENRNEITPQALPPFERGVSETADTTENLQNTFDHQHLDQVEIYRTTIENFEREQAVLETQIPNLIPIDAQALPLSEEQGANMTSGSTEIQRNSLNHQLELIEADLEVLTINSPTPIAYVEEVNVLQETQLLPQTYHLPPLRGYIEQRRRQTSDTSLGIGEGIAAADDNVTFTQARGWLNSS